MTIQTQLRPLRRPDHPEKVRKPSRATKESFKGQQQGSLAASNDPWTKARITTGRRAMREQAAAFERWANAGFWSNGYSVLESHSDQETSDDEE